MSKTHDAVVDDMLEQVVNICRIGAQPGGSQLLDALFPGTLSAVRSAEQAQDELQDRPIVIRTCPVCRFPHPSDIACKPGEARDNGGTLTRREDL